MNDSFRDEDVGDSRPESGYFRGLGASRATRAFTGCGGYGVCCRLFGRRQVGLLPVCRLGELLCRSDQLLGRSLLILPESEVCGADSHHRTEQRHDNH